MITFDRLFILMKKRGILKKDLVSKADVSNTTISRMYKNQSVSTDTLNKICIALNCEVSDIMEFED